MTKAKANSIIVSVPHRGLCLKASLGGKHESLPVVHFIDDVLLFATLPDEDVHCCSTAPRPCWICLLVFREIREIDATFKRFRVTCWIGSH